VLNPGGLKQFDAKRGFQIHFQLITFISYSCRELGNLISIAKLIFVLFRKSFKLLQPRFPLSLFRANCRRRLSRSFGLYSTVALPW
jgi:hypothetical protein